MKVSRPFFFNFSKKAGSNRKALQKLSLNSKKAFDVVDHDMLLRKLYNYGVCGLFFELVVIGGNNWW